jgi:hypothetical protein
MATRFANIKGIKLVESPMGTEKGSIVEVSFDLAGTAYTGGTDTVQLGAGGNDGALAIGSLTLAQVIAQNHMRDGKTWVIQGVAGSPNVSPGNQAAATNGPLIYAQSAATSAGNVTLNLFSAPTAGSAITTTTAAWERAMVIALSCTAS